MVQTAKSILVLTLPMNRTSSTRASISFMFISSLQYLTVGDSNPIVVDHLPYSHPSNTCTRETDRTTHPPIPTYNSSFSIITIIIIIMSLLCSRSFVQTCLQLPNCHSLSVHFYFRSKVCLRLRLVIQVFAVLVSVLRLVFVALRYCNRPVSSYDMGIFSRNSNNMSWTLSSSLLEACQCFRTNYTFIPNDPFLPPSIPHPFFRFVLNSRKCPSLKRLRIEFEPLSTLALK
jgi:hypothetical protein